MTPLTGSRALKNLRFNPTYTWHLLQTFVKAKSSTTKTPAPRARCPTPNARPPGWLHASHHAQLEFRRDTNTKIRTTDSVEIMHTDMVKLEFNTSMQTVHFMDPETFEDVILNESLIEEARIFWSRRSLQYSPCGRQTISIDHPHRGK